MCRRAHGAPLVTWVGLEKSALTIVDDQHLRDYSSSPGATRSFCGECGTSLLFRSERWPDEVHVVRSAFAEDLDLRGKAHAFYDDRAPWFDLHDALPLLGGQSGTEPLT